MKTLFFVFLLSFLMCLAAQGAVPPREAAKLSATETAARNRRQPGRVLLTLGLHELRDSSPQSLIQMDLQVPVFRTLALGVQAMAPTKRKDLSYYVGGALHWYQRAPQGGLWLQAGMGRYNFRKTSGLAAYTSGRAMVGWRWRPADHNGSFGLALGPEVGNAGGKTAWGGVVRFDVGADFSPKSFFQ